MSTSDDEKAHRLARAGYLASLSLFALAVAVSPAKTADIARISSEVESPVKTVNLSDRGPEIVLLAPEEGGTYVSPIGIEIAFKPEPGTTVDLGTLKVTVVSNTAIGTFEADITEDIVSYASQKGISAPNAEIPAGEHVVTIQVADSERRMAERQLAITVREESALERNARD
ncbi:MAG: hypothetical protein ACR2QF_06615 [Geminicoccaceae bacterium]